MMNTANELLWNETYFDQLLLNNTGIDTVDSITDDFCGQTKVKHNTKDVPHGS